VTESSWVRVARVEDLDGDGPFALSGDGVDLVAVRTASGLKAYQGLCPHQGALLGEGELDGDHLVCRNHRWRYRIATGERIGGPQCLVACPVETRDGALWADVAPLRRRTGATTAARTLDDLPGPRGIPVLGNALQFKPSRSHEILEGWAAEHGPLFKFRLGPNRAIGVADPELNERILRARPDGYRRASTIAPVLEEVGGNGVFAAEGAAWRSQRRLAVHALSQRNIRGFYPTLLGITERLRARWERKADAGEVLDMADEAKRFLVDVTTLLAFGHDVNTLEQEGDVIQRRLELIFPAITKRLFAVVPTWRWVRMPADRRLDRALAEVHAWLGERIADARARIDADPALAEQPENFLQSMVAARDADGNPFPDDVILGNAMTMLLAGEDTTAYTLAWAVHHLCDAPHAVEALRAESDGRVPEDIESANRLAYAGAVASEAMRVRPVAPLLLLEATRDTVIGDVAVPAGTWVACLLRPPAVDARHFHAPGEFRPERWLRGTDDAATSIPFGSGPRICPGRGLAALEAKLVLAMLYGSFDVERVGAAADVEERFAFTMFPVGLKVQLRRR
jgi:cytochrome P450/nitrite reductase/ring-hydroxylating ferredoxin subunit